eukprot:PLAT4676.1.p1 GENE.PLAT4676.1~~PLAT4676.1.p1  ORF type:complete len:648 (-),score=223.25 PLAT4676.1:128-2071(-)
MDLADDASSVSSDASSIVSHALMGRGLPEHELIARRTLMLKKKQRARGRHRIRPGPGRPTGFFDSPGKVSTPGPSTMSPIARNASTGALGAVAEEEEAVEGSAVELEVKARIEELQQGMRDMRSRSNQVRHAIEGKQEHLAKLRADEKELARKEAAQRKYEARLKRLEAAQSSLDDWESKIEGCLAYQQVLTHMTNRLKRHGITHEKTLRVYEESLSVLRKEASDMLIMAAEVRQAKDKEEAELNRLTKLAMAERDAWQEDLDRRRALAKQREEMKQWFEGRRKDGTEEAKTTEVDITRRKEMEAEVRRDLQYKTLFEKLRLVTGLTEDEDIVDRFVNRSRYSQRLEEQLKGVQDRMATLKEEKRDLRDRLEAAKYSGGSSSGFSRAKIDSLTSKTDEARRKLRTVQAEHDKLRKYHMEVEQSLSGLFKQLAGIKLPKFRGREDEYTSAEKATISLSKLQRLLDVLPDSRTSPRTPRIKRRLSALKAPTMPSGGEEDNNVRVAARSDSRPSSRDTSFAATREALREEAARTEEDEEVRLARKELKVAATRLAHQRAAAKHGHHRHSKKTPAYMAPRGSRAGKRTSSPSLATLAEGGPATSSSAGGASTSGSGKRRRQGATTAADGSDRRHRHHHHRKRPGTLSGARY